VECNLSRPANSRMYYKHKGTDLTDDALNISILYISSTRKCPAWIQQEKFDLKNLGFSFLSLFKVARLSADDFATRSKINFERLNRQLFLVELAKCEAFWCSWIGVVVIVAGQDWLN
jgi:hypothetical protein